ncbi:AAA family ATPase [Rhizobium sp. PP-CC-3G-465]|uniref:AAA family ATPase n=1 Tax=Rhizobium sp. PP-CC-3G-465 TaxID=2135648 RepID=UPI001046D54B|nr:AAA domain-containing protein [Rhizobium sp. PP-CC-3G-465]
MSVFSEEQEAKTSWNMVWAHDIGDEDNFKEWVVRDVFAECEFSYIVGLPGTGKSMVATDIACHLAAGWDWHGYKVKTPRMVIYVAAERASLTRRRIKAWRKKHAHTGTLPVLVVSGYMDLTKDLSHAYDLAELICDAEEQMGMDCGLLVLDTLTRVFGGGDQNAAKDMGKLINSVDVIQEKVPDMHVSVIHHTTHAGTRAKGAIDLDGAVDVSFSVAKRGKSVVFENTGANDGKEGDLLAYEFESVMLGKDQDGEWTTAPVLIPVDMPEPDSEVREKRESERERQRRARRQAFHLSVVNAAFSSGGDDESGWWWLSGVIEADTRFKATNAGKAAGNNWGRIRDALVKDGELEIDDVKNAYRLKLSQKPLTEN